MLIPWDYPIGESDVKQQGREQSVFLPIAHHSMALLGREVWKCQCELLQTWRDFYTSVWTLKQAKSEVSCSSWF